MTEPPTILSLTAADLTWLLRELTIEIVAACSDDAEDPQRRITAARLRRISEALRERDERALSAPLRRVLIDLAAEIDQTP